jgi:methionyl-tRNA formyltransferase
VAFEVGSELRAALAVPGLGPAERLSIVIWTTTPWTIPANLAIALGGRATYVFARVRTRRTDAAPEVIVVAAYGLILPPAVLDVPPRGCLNVHGSILPRHRGAAPITSAILAGDEETGITIMKMDAANTGPMLSVAREPIRPDDTTASPANVSRISARLIGQLPKYSMARSHRSRSQRKARLTAPRSTRPTHRSIGASLRFEIERMVRVHAVAGNADGGMARL